MSEKGTRMKNGTTGGPELSIVITTRDRYRELKRCVESVANSRIDMPCELIVIDDCSRDETQELEEERVSSWFPAGPVTVYHSDENIKMVRARNKGAMLARGRFVLFVDDDNIVDEAMITELVRCAESAAEIGITGPSIYTLDTGQKYFDYQTINLFTMRTRFHTLTGPHPPAAHESDGMPNVFLIKREVFDRAGYFDDCLIQSFTEPDFTYNARNHGFRTVCCTKAKTYHDIDLVGQSRHFGSTSAKAYCLIRNRFVIARRYGRLDQLLVFLLLFSWIWPAAYSAIALKTRDYKRIRYYLAGFVDGYYYALTARFRVSSSIEL